MSHTAPAGSRRAAVAVGAAGTRHCHATLLHEREARGRSLLFPIGARKQLKMSLVWPGVKRAQNRNKRLTLMMNARFSSCGAPRVIVSRCSLYTTNSSLPG